MLGDIVPNTARPTATKEATKPAVTTQEASKPLPSPSTGYGASSFGPAKPVEQSSPETSVAPAVTGRSSNKVPFALTILGIVVFVGGVSGLFVYALTGS